MSYQLVIAEKPSVARSIAGVIGADKKQDGYMEGNGYLVSWCIGHLVSLTVYCIVVVLIILMITISAFYSLQKTPLVERLRIVD